MGFSENSYTITMKRGFDFAGSAVAAVFLFFPMLLIGLLVKLTSAGPVIHWSDRVGRENIVFWMPKFRTMIVGTPPVATHLMKEPGKFLTPIGAFLRRTSLDELPQIYNILRGELSFVGPRPALFNQNDLIALRTAKGIHLLLPGLTGWAQVNGRDELSIADKVFYDEDYLNRRSFFLDLKILLLTVFRVTRAEGVSH